MEVHLSIADRGVEAACDDDSLVSSMPASVCITNRSTVEGSRLRYMFWYVQNWRVLTGDTTYRTAVDSQCY